MSPPLHVRLFGPLAVSRGAEPVPVSAGRLRALTALLALSANRSVGSERLVDELWGEELPDNPRRTLHTYINRLRSLLGAEVITTDPHGYTLRIDPDQVDVLRFARLLAEARSAPDRTAERLRLESALSLWRDDPFADIDLPVLHQVERPRLVEAYLTASERRIDLDVDHGQLDGPIEELAELTARYPLRESLWVRQLRLLDRSGRRAEALDRYEQIRTMIADQLGSDPSAALRGVHADLLTDQPRDPPPADPAPVPRQLPPDLRVFAGREDALRQLDRFLTTTVSPTPVLITGPAGVGKTSLAVHWAHRLADRFPDGHLYVNLRGFDPSERVLHPAAALRGFLDTIAPELTKRSELEELAAQFRSLMAGRRMLILLDNARDSDQVLPLLPGADDSLVLVTSRNQLPGLIAGTGAHPLEVTPVDLDDARRLLATRLGQDRVHDEPAAAAELLNACAGLPLAIALVSARAATQPQLPLVALAAELRETPRVLDSFGADGAASDLRSVFSWSFNTLSAAAAAAFRLLGLHPGPDLSTTAFASLLGISVTSARAVLIELCRVHLLVEHRPGRYASHDLVSSYAAELAGDLPEPVRSVALRRMVDHYLYTARDATLLLASRVRPLTASGPPLDGVTVAAVSCQHDAQLWFAAEHDQLVEMIELAAEHPQLHHQAYLLYEAVSDNFDLQTHWFDWEHCSLLILHLARRAGDRHEEAVALLGLGAVNARLGKFADSVSCFERAQPLFAETGDDRYFARAENNLGKVAWLTGNTAEAIRHTERAQRLYADLGDRTGVTWARIDLAWFYCQSGDYQRAFDYCALVRRAVEGDAGHTAPIVDTEGYIYFKQGDLDRAEERMRTAVDLYRSVGDRLSLAEVLDHLGDVLQAKGDLAAAVPLWQQAYEILVPIGHPLSEPVHRKITEVAADVRTG